MKESNAPVIVKRYTNVNEANIDRSFLEDNGIECFINNANMGELFPFMSFSDISICVAQCNEERAKELLENGNEQETK